MIKIEGGRARSFRTAEEELKLLRQKWGAFSAEEQEFIIELMGREDADAEQILAEIKSAHYHREPVSIDTFLDDPYYSGPGGSSVYPRLREELREIFRGNYSEVILSGCVALDEPVLLADGRMVDLGDLLDSEEVEVSLADGSTQKACPKYSGVQPVVRVTLQNGMSVKLTADHLVECFDFEGRKWVAAGELTTEHFVAVPRYWKTVPSSSVEPDTAMLIGYWQGDGSSSSSRRRARFTDGRKQCCEHVIDLLRCLGFDGFLKPKKGAACWYVLVKSAVKSGFLAFLDEYGVLDQKTGDERVPQAIASSSDKTVSAYLRGLYDCEGCVYLGNPPRINLGMKSQRFLREVQLLLLRFGIHGSLQETPYSTHGGHGYTLSVSGADPLALFLDCIGDLSSKLDECSAVREYIRSVKANTNVDVMPFTAPELSKWMSGRIVRPAGSRWWNLSTGGVSRRLSFQLWQEWKSEFGSHDEASDLIARFPDGSRFVPVRSVQEVGLDQHVGDMCVESDHRFVSAGISTHNSIGWGKSYTATYGLMYSVYRTTCLRDPQLTFGLAPGTMIWFAFLSMYRKHAGETIFEDIRTKVESSPYFYELMEDTKGAGFSKYQAKISKSVKLICESSTSNKVIGLNVFGGMFDEVNFGESARVAKDAVTLNTTGKTPPTKVEKVYRSIIARINSRFMRNGSVPGVLFVVSSKNNESDFTQKRIQESLNDPSVYVMDFPEWETKPPGKYSGKRFRVFFGGKTMRSRVLDDDEDPPVVTDDLQRIVEVPVEYKEQFEEGDIEIALRDVAGIAVPRVMPFIQRTDAIHGMYYDRKDPMPLKSVQWVSGREEPFRWDVLCEKGKPRKLGDQVEVNWMPRVNPDAPRHVHIDPSKNRDSTGFAMGHVEKMVEVTQRDTHTGELYKEMVPLIYLDVVLQVVPPDESEIEMELLRKLVYSLTGHGFPIHYISTDQNQTVDMIQQFEKKGYEAEVRSLDRKPTGYKHLKSALYQRRLRCYNYFPLNEELENLQWDSAKEKVDHPITLSDGRPGSKDVADAVAGVVWSLTDKQSGAPPVVKPDDARVKPEHPLEHWMNVGQNPQTKSDAGPLFDIPFLMGGGK